MFTKRPPDIKDFKVKLPSGYQEFVIGNKLQKWYIDEIVSRKYHNIALFIDPNLIKLYPSLVRQFTNNVKPTVIINVDPKESSKGLDFLNSALHKCYEAQLNRNSCIIAIGGGVVGDIAGFLASVYMRGINFIFIPSTLMAQGDSIVNKVAISFRLLKNILGSFYSPSLTVCDTDFLKTLSENEIKMGLSEIIKHALIVRSPLLGILRLQFKTYSITQWKKFPWKDIIYHSLRVKTRLVQNDPHDDKGIQKGISYGHTIANALEGSSNYSLRHGVAITLGMRIAGTVSHQLGMLSSKDLELQNSLLDYIDLPKTIPRKVTNRSIIDLLSRDKISTDGRITLVLLKGINKFKVVPGINPTVISSALENL